LLSGPGSNQKILDSDYALRLSDNAQITPRLYNRPYNTSGLCELPNSAAAGESCPLRKEVPLMRLFGSESEASTEAPGNRGKAPIMNDHHIIEEEDQEAAIEAFLVAHEDHTQEVEIQRGSWSIYCHCKRCGEIHTYEVDNEARQQVLGLPPRQEEDKEEALYTGVRGR
jgi:hypothetical protein